MQRDVKLGASHFAKNNLCCLGLFLFGITHIDFVNAPGLSVPSPSVKAPPNAGKRERLAGDRLDRLD